MQNEDLAAQNTGSFCSSAEQICHLSVKLLATAPIHVLREKYLFFSSLNSMLYKVCHTSGCANVMLLPLKDLWVCGKKGKNYVFLHFITLASWKMLAITMVCNAIYDWYAPSLVKIDCRHSAAWPEHLPYMFYLGYVTRGATAGFAETPQYIMFFDLLKTSLCRGSEEEQKRQVNACWKL